MSETVSGLAPVAVFAIGNPSRGDDALGPALLARFADWLAVRGRSGEFELLEDFQLQIEHAVDLQGRNLALFIDAGVGTPGPWVFRALRAEEGLSHSSHALSPEAVLRVYGQTFGEAPPPAYVLCIRGESFELGEPLSPAAQSNLESAFGKMQELAERATSAAWAEVA